jgi:hypothetical protein
MTTDKITKVAATDLSTPHLPAGLRVTNTVLRPVAHRAWPLDVRSITTAARRAAGLDDFGDQEPLAEPLALLCRSLNEQVRLHPVGRLAMHRTVVSSLVNRLRLQDLVSRRPEVLQQTTPGPLIVTGPPRSGTTLTQRLLARDPAWRAARLWELWDPVPADGFRTPAKDGERAGTASMRRALARWRQTTPGMDAIHEVGLDVPEEEILVLGSAFSSFFYEWCLGVPRFADWYAGADHTAGYRYLRRTLQAMQWGRPAPGRWLLKSPQHLEQIRPLLTVFPDATLVHTHRDPVSTVASTASFIAYRARAYLTRPDLRAAGELAAGLTERLLRAAVRDRAGHEDQIVDVSFRRLCQDPIDALRPAYAAAGVTLRPAAEAQMRAWLADNPQGKHGRHSYDLPTFGLDEPALRERFGFYYQRYPEALAG